jgi:hypothetical protein
MTLDPNKLNLIPFTSDSGPLLESSEHLTDFEKGPVPFLVGHAFRGRVLWLMCNSETRQPILINVKHRSGQDIGTTIADHLFGPSATAEEKGLCIDMRPLNEHYNLLVIEHLHIDKMPKHFVPKGPDEFNATDWNLSSLINVMNENHEWLSKVKLHISAIGSLRDDVIRASCPWGICYDNLNTK